MSLGKRILMASTVLATTLVLSSCSFTAGSSDSSSAPGIPAAPSQSAAAPAPVQTPTQVALPSVKADKQAAMTTMEAVFQQMYDLSPTDAANLEAINARYDSLNSDVYVKEMEQALPAFKSFENPKFGERIAAAGMHSFTGGFLTKADSNAGSVAGLLRVSGDTSVVELANDQQKASFPLSAIKVSANGRTIALPSTATLSLDKVDGVWYLDLNSFK